MKTGEASDRRRRPGEVRSLLIDSARSVFCSKGFSGASTREIADGANVSEALLFRHFKSKANLFNEAVLAPLDGFLKDVVAVWRSERNESEGEEQLLRRFVALLFDALRAHRDLAIALLAASAHEPAAFRDGLFRPNPIEALDELSEVVTEEMNIRGLPGVDAEVVTRAVSGMVLVMALFQEWMFDGGSSKPSHERAIDEIVAVALRGVARSKAAGSLRSPSSQQESLPRLEPASEVLTWWEA